MLCETWDRENHYSYCMIDWTTQVQRHFHSLHADQLYSPPNSFISNGYQESLVDKQTWSTAKYLLPRSAKIKILWSHTFIPLHAFNADTRKGIFITNKKRITLNVEKSCTDYFNEQMSKETNMQNPIYFNLQSLAQ